MPQAFPSLHSRRRRDAAGSALVDLAALLAVAALLLALALPSLLAGRERHRLDAQLDALMDDLRFARAQAAARGRSVAVCAGEAGACAPRNIWNRGRLVYVDLDGNGRLDPGEPVLRTGRPGDRGDTLFETGGASSLAFGPGGQMDGLPAEVRTFTLRTDGQELVRCLRLSGGGHLLADTRRGTCA